MAARAVKPVLCGLALAFSLHFAIATAYSTGDASDAAGKAESVLSDAALRGLSLEDLDEELQV